MRHRTRKMIALLAAAVWMAGLLAACGAPETQEEALTDLDAQRQEFRQAAESRQVEHADGFTPHNVRVTEGDKLVDVAYPAVDSNAGISAELENYVNERIGSFDQEAADMGAPDAHTGIYALTITYKPYQVGTGIAGVKFTESAYTGKTNVQNSITAFMYDTETGRKLELADVFDEGQDYLAVVSEKARDYLNRNNIIQKTKDEQLFQEGTKPLGQNFSNFAITPDNQIVFFFNKNTVAPDVAGAVEVCIPLADFDAVLNPATRDKLFGKPLTQPAPSVSAAPGESANPAVPAATDIPQLNLGAEYLPPHSIEGIDPLNTKVVALTFDDGPGPYTEELLNILSANDVKATFFLIGENIGNYPDMVKREFADGHEIANHSWDHKDLKTISFDAVMNDQYGRTNDKLQEMIGYRATLYRPPYGSMSEELAQQIGREQIIWSVDTNDWRPENKDPAKVLENATQTGDLRDGAVILMHDIHQTTVQAVDSIIKELKNQGYTFVTVSQMMQIAEARGQDVSKYKFFNGHTPEGGAKTPEPEVTYGTQESASPDPQETQTQAAQETQAAA